MSKEIPLNNLMEELPPSEKNLVENETSMTGAFEQARIESLMKTGIFNSKQEAQENIAHLDKSLEALAEENETIDAFENNFNSIIEEAEKQLKAIEESAPGELIDRSALFQEILDGIVENFEELKPDIEGTERRNIPAIIEAPKKIGRFVRKNKAAFIAFGVFSLLSRIGINADEAEASEAFHSDIGHDFPQIVDNSFDHTQHLDAVMPSTQEISTDQENNKEWIIDFKDKMNKEISNNGALYTELSSRHVFVKQDLGKENTDKWINSNEANIEDKDRDGLIEKANNGGVTLRIMTLSQEIMKENINLYQDKSNNTGEAEFVWKTVISEQENNEQINAESKEKNVETFEGFGSSRSDALINTIVEYVNSISVHVQAEFKDMQQELKSGNIIKSVEEVSSESYQASDETITITSIEVSENEYSEKDSHLSKYKVKITVNSSK